MKKYKNRHIIYFWLSIAIFSQSCTQFDVEDYYPHQMPPKPDAQLEVYADTSITLARIKGFPSVKQQVDSLIYFAEWLKNYKENISLLYAQQAYDLATEKNWNIPRGVSANRLAWSKGLKAIYDGDVEEAMVDAKIGKRLLAPYKDTYWQMDTYHLLGYLFNRKEVPDSPQIYLNKALDEVEALTDQELINKNKAKILHNLATTYSMDDTLQRMELYHQCDSLYQLLGDQESRTDLLLDWGIFFVDHKKFTDAEALFDQCLTYGNENKDLNTLALAYIAKGNLYSQKFKSSKEIEDYNQALNHLKTSLNYDADFRYRPYQLIGNVFQDSWSFYIDDSHADSAVYYYKIAMEGAKKEGAINQMRAMSNDIAYLCSYTPGLDKKILGENIGPFLAGNFASAAGTITNNADKAYQRINKDEQRDIRVDAADKRRNQLFIGLAIFFLSVIIFLFTFLRQQNQRLKAQMEALRAQINPHFMSNSLNAIENLVNKGDTKAASKYLVRFSRLTRQILTGSRSSTTNLANELKTLEHFLALEQLRFRDKLTYDIKVDPEIPKDSVRIPTMILQPYVENAILHGIKPKPEGGNIAIRVQRDKKILICSIEDNGIGREKSMAMRKASALQHKSMGMEITQNRLKAIGKIKGSQIQIQDLKDNKGQATGTKVVLKLPYKLIKDSLQTN